MPLKLSMFLPTSVSILIIDSTLLKDKNGDGSFVHLCVHKTNRNPCQTNNKKKLSRGHMPH
jgi:hypothetical protein